MRLTLTAAVLTILCIPAHAINRYNTNTMSCAEVQAAVKRDGQAILRYPSKRNPQIILYNRYVRDGGFCEKGDYGARGFVPTRDVKSCRVMYCKGFTHDS